MKNILISILGGVLLVGFLLSTGCKKDSSNGGSSSSWTAVGGNGLPSGSVIKSVSARNNILYALVYTEGADKSSPSDVSVYSSPDNGENWSLTGVWATGVNGGSSEIYATESHLIISNGVEFYMNDISCSGSWNTFTPTSNDWGQTIEASSASNIFANATDLFLPYYSNTSGKGGLFWSTDDGQNFSDIGTHNISAFPTESFCYVTVTSAGYYAFGQGVYRKGDLNPNWTRIDQGLPASINLSSAYVGADKMFTAQNNTVYSSSDNGNNWSVYGSYPPDVPNTKFGLYYLSGKLLWFDRSGIYATSNGSSWSNFTSGMDLNNESLYTHVFGPAYSETNDYLFVCTNKHIYKLKK